MVFVKNPVLGKVKTRLAKSLGDEKALGIYKIMLRYTRIIAMDVDCDKAVFYSDFVEAGDKWSEAGFAQQEQKGDDLGERMLNAFKYAFPLQYRNVVIIGSDCLELNDEIIADAFDYLEKHEIVLGSAKDGGYYLLGMKKLYPELFVNKQWSTSSVLPDTLKDVSMLNVSMK